MHIQNRINDEIVNDDDYDDDDDDEYEKDNNGNGNANKLREIFWDVAK